MRRVLPASLAPPAATASPEEHADWLELIALADADRQSSIEDLVSALRTTSSMEDLEEELATDTGSEQAQAIAEDAMAVAEQRAAHVIDAKNYPFDFIGQTLTARRTADASTYAFLLLLSKFGKDAGPTGTYGARLFEQVSGEAARNYLGGPAAKAEVIIFGFPRPTGPSGFRDALDHLCITMKEGGGAKHAASISTQKDAKLDIVAWLPMPDARTSKFVGFGQCATGHNWRDKVSELQADTWCRIWMLEPPPVSPTRMFFLPHRVSDTEWDIHASYAGVIFDRCRIAAYAARLPQFLRHETKAWSKHVLKDKLN